MTWSPTLSTTTRHPNFLKKKKNLFIAITESIVNCNQLYLLFSADLNIKSWYLPCKIEKPEMFAKRGFYRAANSIFGKVGRIASESEEVVIHLIRTKCVPILLYGPEALPLNK